MKNLIKYITDRIRKKPLLVKPDVINRLIFVEIGDIADKWLDDEIAKEPTDNFTNREKYWMIEGFIQGYTKAQNGL